MLVGLGATRGGRTDKIEILDLESPSKTCENLPNFPFALYGSFGGLGFQDKPIMCGGRNDHNTYFKKCFYLEENEWTFAPRLNSPRLVAAVSSSPYPSKSQKLFVTGGRNDDNSRLNTAEVLTEHGWKSLPQTLPVTIFSHCSVLVNETTVMVIGGLQNDQKSSKTYYLNTEKEDWVEGPQLKTKRWFHSCGRIRKNSQSAELSVIVAGGFDKSSLSSVEILDHGSTEWKVGPDLPIEIYYSQMVEHLNGGVVLVGGTSLFNNNYLDTLFQLPHGGADAEWIRMKQKLKVGRNNHVAFLVPDNTVVCS